MILVKNRLKKVKRDNEDDMLHYLKYSHLDDIPEENFNFMLDNTEYEDKATQFPDIRNRSTQTHNKEMEDKETDTFDHLHKIDYQYFLKGNSKRHRSDEKLRGSIQTQVETVPVLDKDDESRNRENDDPDNFLTRNVKRGFRLAEFALNSSLVGANLTLSIADAIAEATLSNHNDYEEENENEVPEYATSNTAQGNNHPIAISVNSQFNNTDEVISVNSSPPMTVNSSSPAQTIHSSSPSASSASSIPAPTSPQSSRASSRSSRSSRSSLYNPRKKR